MITDVTVISDVTVIILYNIKTVGSSVSQYEFFYSRTRTVEWSATVTRHVSNRYSKLPIVFGTRVLRSVFNSAVLV